MFQIAEHGGFPNAAGPEPNTQGRTEVLKQNVCPFIAAAVHFG